MPNDWEILNKRFEQLLIGQTQPVQTTKPTVIHHRKEIKKPCKITRNDAVMNIDLISYSMLRSANECYVVNNVLSYRNIEKSSTEFRQIKNLFGRRRLVVKSVKGVINPYLKQAFELKRMFHYNNVEPLTLYHGTKKKHIEDICTFNFNWRLSGSEKGHRFGMGVNFSKNPFFAAFFCDKKLMGYIIIADVLVNVISPGREDLKVPPKGSDTTKGKGSNVLVKFCDSEFCPKYVVEFVRV